MKISRIAGLAVVLAALVPAAMYAQAPAEGAKKKGPPAFAGVVKSVDATAKTVTIENKKTSESKTFKVTDKTKIKIDEAEKTLADLTPGLRVRISQGKDPEVAAAINGSTAPPKGKGPKKEATPKTQ
jgi:hypothetical protein